MKYNIPLLKSAMYLLKQQGATKENKKEKWNLIAKEAKKSL